MSEKLNIKDFPHHTHAAIIEVANTAIAKAYEAGQRHLPESVEAVLEAVRAWEARYGYRATEYRLAFRLRETIRNHDGRQ